VPLEAGTVTLDRTALVRRTASIQIPWSLDSGADLGVDLRDLPLGGYALLYRGLRYADGSTELAQLGVLRVESVSWLTLEDRASLELADRMAQIRDEELTSPYQAGGKKVAQAIWEIASGVFGFAINYHIIYDPPIVLADAFYSGSRTDALTKLADSVGGEAYFDALGDFVFDGAPGSILIQRNGTLTDDSPTITGLATTADLVVGMSVSGLGIPAGRRIRSLDSATQITLNGPVNIYGYKNSQTTAGSSVVTDLTDTSDLMSGMSVSGQGIPAGATIRSVDGPDRFTLSVAATQTGYPILIYSCNPVQLLTFMGAYGSPQNPVWTVDAGERGVMVDADEALDRTGVYNGVLVQGQAAASDATISALVTDDDPLSATRWGGPFGRVVRIEQSSAVQTVAQAQDTATALLDRRLGLTRSLVLTNAPNPALEPGDVIDVRFPDGRAELHWIDAIRLDLGATGAQSLSTRSVYTPAQRQAQVPLPPRRRYKTHYGRAAWREANRGRRAKVPA
jgi:Domain of unknown function (DUF5047)